MKQVALLLLVVALAACKDKPASGAAPIAVGVAIPSYVHAVAWITEEQGYFEEAGLSAKVDVMGGSAATMRSILAGTTEVGIAGGDAVIKANAAGGDLVVVAGVVNRFYHRLIARKGIERPADLKGKKIGLPFLGGPQDMAVRYVLRSYKLEYGKDVSVLNLGKEMNRMAALSRGDIDATMSQTPPSQLSKLGFKVLADLPAEDVEFPYAVVVVRKSYLQANQQRMKSFLQALCKGIDFYRTHEKESVAIVEKHLHGSDTDAAAQERYKTGGPSLISFPPVPSEKGFQMVLDFVDTPETRALKLAELFDLRILDELRKGGECGGT
jgi:NitT/TauT family transport system substrate-binding protein